MIVSLEGHEKTGKSAWAYTAPLPIVSFSLDMGHERAIYGTLFPKFFEGLTINIVPYVKGMKLKDELQSPADITIYELPSPMQLDADKLAGYMEQWDYFLDRYVEHMTNKVTKTIVIDTMTLMRKHKVNAYLQELQGQGKARKQLQQIEYGHPDGAIRDLYTFAKSAGKNLIATHHLRDHYAPGMSRDGVITTVADGTFEIDGVKDTARFADVVLRMEKDKTGKLETLLVTCGPNLQFEGNKYPNNTWDKLVDIIELGWHGQPFQRRTARLESAK